MSRLKIASKILLNMFCIGCIYFLVSTALNLMSLKSTIGNVAGVFCFIVVIILVIFWVLKEAKEFKN